MGNVEWGTIPSNISQGASTVVRINSSITDWELKSYGIIHIPFLIKSPSVGGSWIIKCKQNMVIVRIDSCVYAATSATFNIEVHSDPKYSGYDVLGTDMVADTGGESSTTFIYSAINEGDWLFIDISGVSGSPTILTGTITCKIT